MGSNLSEVFPNFKHHIQFEGFDGNFDSDSEDEIFPLLECPDCGEDGGVEATDDGNRDQICDCGKVLMKDGVKKI